VRCSDGGNGAIFNINSGSESKKIPVSLSVIQGKALSVYEDWKKLLGEGTADTPEFQASKG
jgi:hypothetical protein